MRRTAVWRGLDAPRMEIARVELSGAGARVSGTQLGVSYELRYALEPGLLTLELVGSRVSRSRLTGSISSTSGFRRSSIRSRCGATDSSTRALRGST